MPVNVTFNKTGKEIKAAIANRVSALQERLDKRNESLDVLLKDEKRLRSYLVRSSQQNLGHGNRGGYTLNTPDDISSEDKDQIDQMLRRINEIQQEILRLKLIANNIEERRTFELSYNDLVSYGFGVAIE